MAADWPTADSRGLPWAFDKRCGGRTKAGKPCTNLASIALGGSAEALRCKVHGRGGRVVALREDPHRAERLAAAHAEHRRECEVVAAQNVANGVRGALACQKQRMRQTPPQRAGFLVVCPNYKDGGFKYGLGLPELSPKSMGPIDHGQPGLPLALNLENLHQFNKVFEGEYDAVSDEVLPIFFETQRAAYEDPVPHRHKQTAPTGGNRNIPLFSLWRLADGSHIRLSYGASRQIYCTFYARCVARAGGARDMYIRLLECLDAGWNLLITGYDGYDWTAVDGSGAPLEHHPEFPDGEPADWEAWPEDARRLVRCYRDTSRPFGHELVLLTLLRFPDEPHLWPWVLYRTLEL